MRRLVFTTELVESAGADTHLQAVSITLYGNQQMQSTVSGTVCWWLCCLRIVRVVLLQFEVARL